MKVCEFLLQKEGDRVWLPLEPPTVEILEGRYRIVARTQQPQTEVLVEVSYWSPEEMPPKRRTRHWNRHTNAKGIMPVLPFTALRSGNWRIQCSSNLLMDMGENGWQHVVELRVLAQEGDLENWQPNPQGFSPSVARERKIEPEPAPTSPPDSSLAEASLPDPSLSPPSLSPPTQPRPATVEELRSLAEQMSRLVFDTVLEVGEMEQRPAVSSVEDEETQAFFSVPELEVEPSLQPRFEARTLEPKTLEPKPLEPQTWKSETWESQTWESEAIDLGLVKPPEPLTPATGSETSLETVPETISEAPDRENTPLETPPIPSLPTGLQLRLQTNTIVPSAYSLFELHCYILTANGTPLQESPLPLQARVMLQNPSNMEVRLAMTQLLATQPLSQPFYLSGHIALDWRNQLLLGEVQLQSLSLSVEDLTEAVVTIATVPFTIMPPVDALLTHVSPPEPSTPTPEPPRKPQIKADFLEVTRRSLTSLMTAKGSNDESSHPSPKVVMPPTLKGSGQSPSPDHPRPSLHLPTFVQPASQPVNPPENTLDTTDGSSDLQNLEAAALEDSSLDPIDLGPSDTSSEIQASSSPTPKRGVETLLNVLDSLENLEKEPNQPIHSADVEQETDFAEQLTFLNLAEWTDPSIIPSEIPSESATDAREPGATSHPRKVIELPPVPSRSDVSHLLEFIDPLTSPLSAAELADLARVDLAGITTEDWLETPLESTPESSPESHPQGEPGAIGDSLSTVDNSAVENPAVDNSLDHALEPGMDGAMPLDSEPRDFVDQSERDLEAENEILLSLALASASDLEPAADTDPDSDRFPSAFNVLAEDPSLASPELDPSGVSPVGQSLAPVDQADLDQTPLDQPPAPERSQQDSLDGLEQHETGSAPSPTQSDSTQSDPRLQRDPEFQSSPPPPGDPIPESDPLLLWSDEPVQTREISTEAGHFFSQTDFSPAPPQRSDPVLESFFTEPALSEKPSRLPEPSPAPDPLSFDLESESLEQVQVPPHLRLSELDLGELGSEAQSQSEPFVPDPFVPEHLRQEVVVEDEWLEPDARHWMSLAPPQTIVTWPEDEPLPVPILEIPVGDLVGGENLRVILRLPDTASRLVVKLWLLDCQTRSLAAGPFWAYQFLPTMPHFREAIVDIPVPLGCLEVQVEALTIESDTQRESHKITVVKTIVPPDTSDLSEPAENLLEMEDLLEYLPPTLESLEDNLLDLPEENR
jgi:hypothetical protein